MYWYYFKRLRIKEEIGLLIKLKLRKSCHDGTKGKESKPVGRYKQFELNHKLQCININKPFV